MPRLRLENHTAGQVVIPAPGGKAVMFITMKLQDHNLYGGKWEQKQTLDYTIKKPIRLEAGEIQEVRAESFPARLNRGSVYRAIQLSAVLHLGQVSVQHENLPLLELEVQPTELRIFPKGFQAIKKRPLLTLKRALELGDRKHYFHIVLAGVFLKKENREKACELLTQHLTGDKTPLAKVITTTLQEITDLDIPVGDPEKWLRWWKKR